MKPRCRFFLCLICLSFFPPACAPQNNNPTSGEIVQKLNRNELIARLNDSVFCISINVKGRDSEKRFSVGTGFLIGENLIASAAHVQTKAVEMLEKFEKNSSTIIAWKKFDTGEIIQFPVEIAASDDKSDLAIYRFDRNALQKNQKFAQIKTLVLAENLPPIGEEVLSVGYYGAYEFPFNSIGTVSMIDKGEDIVSDLTLMPGNSGAPIFSLKTGEVLGVTTQVLDLGNETVRFGIAKRAARLRELLRKL